jgi:putative heme-binding domain-containing protein
VWAGQSAVVLSTKAEVRSPIPAEILTRLNLLFDWATELANDSKIKESTREAAIRLLGRRPNHEAAELPLLAGLLDPSVPAPLQKAALGALRHNRGAEVGKLLISSWNRLPPSLRQGGIEVLLSREPWTQQMFEAVESGAIGRNEISLANRQVLFKSPNKEVQQVANKIWKSNPSGNRAEVVAKYRSALSLTGDPLKGRTVWLNNCVVCHYFRGEGNNVGPNLGALTDKTPADFLTAILDPNAAVEPRFVAYNIETKDGRSLTGVVNAETATTLTLVQGGGASEKILRSDIAEIRASGLSLMPEGLEQNISPQDLANLISYLNSAPHPFGSATPEQADAAKKKFLTAATNGVPKIVEAHYRSPHQSWMGELSLASCCQNEHQNRFAWETEPVPATLKPDATQDFLVPVSMGSRSGPFGKFTLRLNGKSVIEFDPALHDQTWHSADGKVRMSYMAMQDSSEESNGILTISVHSSLLEPGKPATFGVVSPASNSQRWFGVYEL